MLISNFKSYYKTATLFTLGVQSSTPGFLMCSSSQLTVEEIEDTGDMENKEVAEETDGKGKSNSVALQINSNL